MAGTMGDDGSVLRLAALLVRAYNDGAGNMAIAVHPETLVEMCIAAKREVDSLRADLATAIRERDEERQIASRCGAMLAKVEARANHWRTVAESRLDITPEDAAHYDKYTYGYHPSVQDAERAKFVLETIRAHAAKSTRVLTMLDRLDKATGQAAMPSKDVLITLSHAVNLCIDMSTVSVQNAELRTHLGDPGISVEHAKEKLDRLREASEWLFSLHELTDTQTT